MGKLTEFYVLNFKRAVSTQWVFLNYPYILCVVQVNLKVILVSGRTQEFLFSHTDTAALITQHIFDNWPLGKSPLQRWLV